MAGYVLRWFTCLRLVTHPCTNRARRMQLRWSKPSHWIEVCPWHCWWL